MSTQKNYKCIGKFAIEEICTSCGICSAICPKNAISNKLQDGFFRPDINDKLCIECGKCVSCCPGINLRESTYEDYTEFYYGHSADSSYRYMAASGGVCTEFLIYLLDTDIVDYIITSKIYGNNNELKPQVIGKNGRYRELLKEAGGSNYCPVDNSELLSIINNLDGTCAIVALPCTQFAINFWRERFDKAGKIKYIVGLLCNHVPSYNATEYLCEEYNRKDAEYIRYRGHGWFGNASFYKESIKGNSTAQMELAGQVPFGQYFSGNFAHMFWQKACIKCKDHFGIFADVTFGDADFIKERDPANIGETAIFIRNVELTDAFDNMQKESRIEIYPVSDKKDLSIFDAIGKGRDHWFMASTDQWARYGSCLESSRIWGNKIYNRDFFNCNEKQYKSERAKQILSANGITNPEDAEIITWGCGDLFQEKFNLINEQYCVRFVCDANPNWQSHTFSPGFKIISPNDIICLQKQGLKEIFVFITINSPKGIYEVENFLNHLNIPQLNVHKLFDCC